MGELHQLLRGKGYTWFVPEWPLRDKQLLDRGFESAGVAPDSVAPEGVQAVEWSVLKGERRYIRRLDELGQGGVHLFS